MEMYTVLNKTYEIVPTPKEVQPCIMCCFSQEECYKIIDDEGFMACGCEFGGHFHCRQV